MLYINFFPVILAIPICIASKDVIDSPNNALSNAAKHVVKGINMFTFDTYKRLSPSEENFVFSPFSLALVLEMLYFLASGDTATEITNVLHINSDYELVGNATNNILINLQEEALLLGNKMYLHKDFIVKEAYKQNVTKFFNAGVENLDFEQSSNASETINSWVSKKTGGTINDLLLPGSLSMQTKMVLISTILFRGEWEHPFGEHTMEDFTLHDGSRKRVVMMMKERKYLHSSHNGMDVLSIPYKNKKQSMIIILPDNYNGLPAVKKHILTLDIKKDILEAGEYINIKILIPKFKIVKSMELKEALKEAGLNKVFDSNEANFSNGVDMKGLEVSSLYHNAYIEVDEQGTKAGAASAMVLTMRSLPIYQVPEFFANHPFMFFIVCSSTNMILFAGEYDSPQ